MDPPPLPHLARLRVRWLALLGLLDATSACDPFVRDAHAQPRHDGGHVAPRAHSDAAAIATTPPTSIFATVNDGATPPSSGTVTRTPIGDGTAWEVRDAPSPELQGIISGLPHPVVGCPTGTFCVHTRPPRDPRRPICAAQVTPPSGGLGGAMFASTVAFAPDVTRRERRVAHDACCYNWFQSCPGGRPLRTRRGPAGPLVAAALASRDDWSTG